MCYSSCVDISPTQQTIPVRKHKVLKIILGIIALIVAGFIFLSLFPQFFVISIIRLKFPPSKTPGLYLSLTPRTVSVDNHLQGMPHSYFGAQFQEPWGNPVKVTDKINEFGLIQLKFADDRVITMGDPAQLNNLLQTFLANEKPGSDNLRNFEMLFGHEALSSEFNFYQAVLSTNINDLPLFSDRKKGVVGSILALLKVLMNGMTAVSQKNDKIYSFQTDKVQGFQWGDPAIDKTVYVDVFDLKGENHHWFSLWGTQNEIDYLLSSITLSP